jgi:hypothetical protein
MNNLEALIKELENKIPWQECINRSVSKASIGWHIEHVLLTINLIIDELRRSDTNKYKWKFKFLRVLILTINKIPRGRAQSPISVQPKNIPTADTLREHCNRVKRKLPELETLNSNNYFEHPFFGNLNLKPAVKFLKLHTKHHLAIINDIIKSQDLDN